MTRDAGSNDVGNLIKHLIPKPAAQVVVVNRHAPARGDRDGERPGDVSIYTEGIYLPHAHDPLDLVRLAMTPVSKVPNTNTQGVNRKAVRNDAH